MHSVLNESDFITVISQAVAMAQRLDIGSKGKNPDYLGGSISKYTKDLIMSFPVLVDDSLTIETAQIVNKANEKNIASMLEILFASMSINGNNGKEILSRYHRNIDSLSMDELIDISNDIIKANESFQYMPHVSEKQIRETLLEMVTELKKPSKAFPVESLNEKSINCYYCRENYNNETVVFERRNPEQDLLDAIYGNTSDPDDNSRYNPAGRERFEWEKRKYEDQVKSNQDKYDLASQQFQYQKDRNKELDKQRQQDNAIKAGLEKLDRKQREALEREKIAATSADKKLDRESRAEWEKEKIIAQNARDKANREEQRRRDEIARRDQLNRDEISINQKRILDSDFKKANELQPTALIVTFNTLDDNNQIADRKSFIAGVKCRMISTSSLDIAERLMVTNKSKLTFKDLIRATTGEIKLASDFLMAVSQQKLDAKNDIKKGEAAKLWSILKKRSIKNNYRLLAKNKNDATAITTLVISQNTIDFIKSTSKLDINIPSNAKLIMNTYNLLCLAIADETNEVAKFLYDGNDQFEMVSFNSLSKEYNDKSTKKELNLISQRR